MNCPDREEDLNAFLDGELPIARSADLTAHLAACPSCARRLAELARLREALARVVPKATVSAELQARIEKALNAEVRPGRGANVVVFRPRTKMIAALSAAAVVAIALVVVSPRDESRDLMAVRDASLRAALAQSTLDPAGAPQAPGFTLASARMDVVAGHTSRVMVYLAGGERITLCVWPANGEGAHGLRTADYQGVDIAYWNDGRNEYWAASAKPAPVLARFVKALGAG